MSTTVATVTDRSISDFALTPEQLRCFREQGYAYVPNLIPRDLMAAIRESMLALMHGETDGWSIDHFQILNPEKYKNPKGTFVPVGVQGPAQASETYRAVADHPNLQSAMSQLLGGPVSRYTDQCLAKSAWITEPDAGRTFYHQDSYYWLLKPEAGCNVWIPCEDVGRDAIALAVMPGSHRAGTLEPHEQYFDQPSFHNARGGRAFKRHRIPNDRVDYSKEELIPMHAGDGLFFTNFTWHRSEPNRTGEHKVAYAIAYQRADRNNKYEADPRPQDRR